jgi:hypothetical protein
MRWAKLRGWEMGLPIACLPAAAPAELEKAQPLVGGWASLGATLMNPEALERKLGFVLCSQVEQRSPSEQRHLLAVLASWPGRAIPELGLRRVNEVQPGLGDGLRNLRGDARSVDPGLGRGLGRVNVQQALQRGISALLIGQPAGLQPIRPLVDLGTNALRLCRRGLGRHHPAQRTVQQGIGSAQRGRKVAGLLCEAHERANAHPNHVFRTVIERNGLDNLNPWPQLAELLQRATPSVQVS